jgi:putative Mg2+ transporter-C (MgtC) family protein
MITHQEIILRLFLSALLGSAVGLERERLDWAAGLRTHMLVSVGATVFMLVSAYGFADVLGPSIVLDPSRVAAQVVSGIGFLGAGTIIFRREIIRGLTTAASLWTVAAVGLSVGGGLYITAAAATILVLIILIGVKPIEKRLFADRRSQFITLFVNRRNVSLQRIESTVEKTGLHLLQLVIQPGETPSRERVQLTVTRTKEKKLTELMERLSEAPGVIEISNNEL